MGTFKEDLRKELRREAAFTAAMKERIVQGSTRRKRKIQWKMPIVSVAFVSILLLFVFLNIEKEQLTPYTVNTLPTQVEDIIELLQRNEVVLPYAEGTNEKQQIVYPDISYIQGGYLASFSHHPMIVEATSTYEIADYVAYKQGENDVVAQVIGRPDDVVTFSTGQVLVNGEVLALPKMIGAIDVPENERQPIQNYYFEYDYEGIEKQYPTISIATVEKDELVVSLGYTIERIKVDDIIGKVVALQKIEPSFLLTETEQAVYDQFKESYDLEVLRNIDPVTIAKMYWVSNLQQDVETNYALLTDVEGLIAWPREEHDERSFNNIQDLSEDEIKMIYAFHYNGIENGQFVKSEGIGGVLNFVPTYKPNTPMSFQMVQNPDGIWQVAFNPLQ